MSLGSAKFEDLMSRLMERLIAARDAYKLSVRRELMKDGQAIALMSEGELEKAAQRLDGLCTRNDLLKVREFGKGKMAQHVVENRAITIETWHKLPTRAKKILNDPEAIVQVASRNTVQDVRVKDLTPEATYRVFPPGAPDLAPVPPDAQGKVPLQKDIPEYFTPVGYECQGDYIVLVGVMLRPIEGQVSCKLRYTKEALTKVLNSVL